MKLNFDIKNKKGSLESDVEKLVEKGMDQHDKNWKDKFNTRHNAKKEMLEIKHKQKLELEDKKQAKKNWFQKIEEERRKTKQLELEEIRRQEESRKKSIKVKVIITILLVLLGLTMMIAGIILVNKSGDPESNWNMLIAIGMFPLFSIAVIWGATANNTKKKKKR
ncbi:unknown [Clostridium sp. CAG:798]|nr:unknown [Clostridium sp. CAG:798]